jgi:hypothetical protein
MRPAAAPAPAPAAKPIAPPALLLPILYIAWAHLCLVAAAALVALRPADFAAYFHQPRTLAVVHLITLGWITSTILGTFYIAAPLALRTPLPAGPADYVAWGAVVLATAGVVTHFWLGRYSGVGWSALPILAGAGWVGGRVVRGVRAAPIQGAVKAHIALAFLNLVGAGILGALLAFDKDRPLLGGSTLPNLYAHFHLAGLGWAAMTILGVGYRMVPMILPSAMPKGAGLWLSAGLLEVGTLGLTAGFLLQAPWISVPALAAASGLAVFLAQVAWMLRHRRPAPAARLKPDYHLWHVGLALACLVLSILLGLALALAPISDYTTAPASVYGVLGLIGFASQMVAGVEIILLPLFAATLAIARGGLAQDPPSPHRMAQRGVQAAAFFLWAAAIPALAAGVSLPNAALTGIGGASLAGAAALGALNSARILRHAFRKRPAPVC